MVYKPADVSEKEVTLRTATAVGRLRASRETIKKIKDQELLKGDALKAGELAGMMAAKKTPELLPLCHPLMLEHIHLSFSFPDPEHLQVEATIKTHGKTGVEMEAMTAVAVALLTVYDFVKPHDKRVVLKTIHLVRKTGGKSGDFYWEQG